MNYIEQKYSSLKRYIMWHFFAKKLNLIQIVEYPKSGGTWMTQLVSDYLGMYYPRNIVPKFRTSVIHGHYAYSDAFNKTILVIRDGRDVAVSYYHHLLLGNDRTPQRVTDYYRKRMSFDNFNDVKSNLPEFIKFLNEEYPKRFNRYSWSDYINSYIDKEDVCIIKYEDMLNNANAELEKVLIFTGVESVDYEKVNKTTEKFSFKSQAQRNQGEENIKSFLRKGIAGDWKNHFSQEAAQVFNNYSGKTLIKLGYEVSDGWIKDIK